MRFAVVMLLVVSAAAQVAGRPGPRGRGRPDFASEGPTADSLLRQVHDDLQALSPADRGAILSRAITSVQRVDSDLVLPWTEELFNLAPQISEDRRAQLEWTPVMNVANNDIDAGLRLLERMDAPSRTMLDAGNDPRALAANSVFGIYWSGGRRGFRRRDTEDDDDDDGPSAKEKIERAKKLEKMKSIAAALGSTGVYPYSAFSPALTTLKQQQPEVHEALFADLLNAFRASPGRYADLSEFIRLLMNERGNVSAPFYREALTMALAAIDRIPTDNLPSMNFSIRGQSTSGQLNNAASVQLMRIVPLIKEIDPAWAAQVLEQHKDVAQFEQARSSPGTIIATGGATYMGPAMSPNRSPQRQLGPVRAAAQSSGDAAKVFLSTVTDPAARAAANAEIAAGLASQNPAEAAAFLGQATQGLSTVDDPAQQLMIVTSLARAAFETGDRASAAQYSERGFRLGEDVVRADYDANPDKPMMSLKGVSDLTTLVTTSMRIDPAGTVARVQAIRYPLLRANLLLNAADATALSGFRGGFSPQRGGRPPATLNSSRPQQ